MLAIYIQEVLQNSKNSTSELKEILKTVFDYGIMFLFIKQQNNMMKQK